MRTGHDRIHAAISIVSLFALSCTGGSGEGGSPVEPSPVPAITSIEPVDAAPGDHVTIHGENLAGEITAVSFDGVPSDVLFASATQVEAVVPLVTGGDLSIVVSADGRASAPFRYRVSTLAPPTITAIQPASAHVGERIVITGMHLSGASGFAVQIGGVRSIVQSATTTRVVAFVPVLPAGAASVRVTVGEGASNEFPLEILRSPPAIVSVTPNPARAGLWVTIRGAYLAGIDVAVLVDGSPAEVRRETEMVEVGAKIPTVTVGTHTVQVVVDGEASAPYSFGVDDFDATGTYDVEAVVIRRYAGLPGCAAMLPEVGRRRSAALGIVDNRPELVARFALDTRQYVGTIDANGRIAAPAGPLSGPAITGLVAPRAADGRLEIDATLRPDLAIFCYYEEHVTGSRREGPGAVPGP
jgi:hypothetical protein